MLTDDKEISREEYDELRRKAVIYDLIEDDIRQNIDEGRMYGPVDDDLVMKLTGMRRYLTMRHAENAAAAALSKKWAKKCILVIFALFLPIFNIKEIKALHTQILSHQSSAGASL